MAHAVATQLAGVSERSRVVCIPDVAPDLERALKVRGLSADTSHTLSGLRAAIPADAKAILVRYFSRLREALLLLTDVAWQQDLLIVVLVRDTDERSRVDEVRSSVLSEDQ